MAKNILLIGSGSKSDLILQRMRDMHGNDVVLVTPEEAVEKALKPEDFENTRFEITAPPLNAEAMIIGIPPSGKDRRRERRRQERQAKKKHK